MFFKVLVLLMLGGCQLQEIIEGTPKVYMQDVKWEMKPESSTEIERFATNLWVDKVSNNIIRTSAGPIIKITVKRSSFINVSGVIEFKVKLVCQTTESNLNLKIKVEGKKQITTIGSTIDRISDQIAREVLSRLDSDYGKKKVLKTT